MAKIPETMSDIQALIDKQHESRGELPRAHLGASQLGHPCDRWIWLSFRWAIKPKFPGRILRLFRRGRLEEAVIVSDLRAIGIDVRSFGESQSRVDLECHVSGSIDAIIEAGLPEAPKKRHIVEFKTHSLKSFGELEKKGVEAAKPEHFVQMQIYMHGTDIDRALYVAVCKDDDRIYTERIRYDKQIAEKFIARGHRLALEERMPPPISTDPSWYLCSWCPAKAFCHQHHLSKEINCRTCSHVSPKPDSSWRCERHASDGIPVDFQRKGCDSHVLHPDLVPWKQKDGLDEWTAVYVIDGNDVANGEPDAHIFSSKEIIANPNECANPQAFTKELRQDFGGKITDA